MNFFKTRATRLLAAAFLAAAPVAPAQSVPPGTRFVMSFFKANADGSHDEKLYIATSPDSLTWSALNGGNPVWAPPGAAPFINVVRDPAIIFENGWFWVAFTSGNYGNHPAFGLVKSQDLLNWTYLGNIQVPLPGATSQLTWNPTFFREGDGSVKMFISIRPNNVGNGTYEPVPDMKTYVTTPLNTAWTQWATPVPLALPSTNTNEFFCWKEGATYHGIYVDFTFGGAWRKVSSTDLVADWGGLQTLFFNSREGGMMFKKPGGGYRFFFEYGNGSAAAYRYSDCSDVFGSFTPEVQLTSDALMRNGKMTPMPGSATFASWAAVHTPATPGPLADPDGDGIPNLLESALGLAPLVPARAALPALFSTGGTVAIRHRRWPQYSDITVTAESSPELSAWSPAVPKSITIMSDGSELVETWMPAGAKFLRVKAAQ